MFIYKTTTKYKDIPQNTFLKFNRSYQYFESVDKESKYKITNDESFHNPHLIIIDREILPTNKQKSREWNPFNKDIKDWKRK